MLKVPKNSRYEIKYVINEVEYNSIRNWLNIQSENFFREHPSRKINNLYFDNYLYENYKSNVYGISSRSKFRLRWYGELISDCIRYFEIKYKRNMYGWKKKFLIKDFFINQNTFLKEININIYKNVDELTNIFFKNYSIPLILNSYLRDYYISKNRKIRVTIDRNYKVFDQRLSNKINLKKSFSYLTNLVIEVKFDRNRIEETRRFINKIPILPSKNSKYANSIRVISGV